MGMFDSIMFNCPSCDSSLEEQSKSGRCMLDIYPGYKVPVGIAEDIIGNQLYCEKCDKTYIIREKHTFKTTVPLLLEEKDDNIDGIEDE